MYIVGVCLQLPTSLGHRRLQVVKFLLGLGFPTLWDTIVVDGRFQSASNLVGVLSNVSMTSEGKEVSQPPTFTDVLILFTIVGLVAAQAVDDLLGMGLGSLGCI